MENYVMLKIIDFQPVTKRLIRIFEIMDNDDPILCSAKMSLDLGLEYLSYIHEHTEESWINYYENLSARVATIRLIQSKPDDIEFYTHNYRICDCENYDVKHPYVSSGDYIKVWVNHPKEQFCWINGIDEVTIKDKETGNILIQENRRYN